VPELLLHPRDIRPCSSAILAKLCRNCIERSFSPSITPITASESGKVGMVVDRMLDQELATFEPLESRPAANYVSSNNG
jgi:hypothetical protein